MPETGCDCFLTRFTNEFIGRSFYFDVYYNPEVETTITFNLAPYFDFEIELTSIQNKSDEKSTNIGIASSTSMSYTFNIESGYWAKPFMTDTFQYTVKNIYTGEIANCFVSIRNLPLDSELIIAEKDAEIDLYSPYAEKIKVHLRSFVSLSGGGDEPIPFVCYKISPNLDPKYIFKVEVNPDNPEELLVDLQKLAGIDEVTTSIEYFVARTDSFPVDEFNTPISAGKIIINFTSA